MSVVIVGGGPAGLMAAEILSRAGVAVTVYDQMPSVGRKLLMAGRGGLNLTHAEPLPVFLSRYGAARAWLEPIIRGVPARGADRLVQRSWASRLLPAPAPGFFRPQ